MVQRLLLEAVCFSEVTFQTDLCDSGKGPLVGWCEYGNEPSAKQLSSS